MGFRDYDPGLNRFLTRDMYNGALADMRLALDPWNMNRYAFAGGNPISFVELDGHRYIVADEVYAHSITGKIVEDRSSSTASGSSAGNSSSYGSSIGNLADYVGDFLAGALFRLADNFTLGYVGAVNPELDPSDKSRAYVEGALAGDLVSFKTGGEMFVSGVGGAVLTSETGVGTLAFGALGVYGGAVTGKSGVSIAEDLTLLYSKGVDSGGSPKITKPYKRPKGATTAAQRASVQGKPCVECGKIAPKMYADHKKPLVVEYYETGTIDRKRMHDLDAVQPHCPTCSSRQGGYPSWFSRKMKEMLGLD